MRIINKKIAITALILCFIAPSIILTTQSGPPPTPQTYSTTYTNKRYWHTSLL